MNKQKRYLSYLLRLWRESHGDSYLWRASLEKPQAGHRMGFASLVELFTYLENVTGSTILTFRHPSEEDDELPTIEE